MVDNSKRTGAALEAHYHFLLWLLPTLEQLPRSPKFTLGDRISAGLTIRLFVVTQMGDDMGREQTT